MRYSLLFGSSPDQPRSWRRLAAVFAAGTTLTACVVGAIVKLRAVEEGGTPDVLNPHIDTFREYQGSLPMPNVAHSYNGHEDKRWHAPIRQNKAGYAHVFALGDWGALLPSHTTARRKASGWIPDAQFKVAGAMKRLARKVNPQYFLNVGDNFYWQGVTESCNDRPHAAWGNAKHSFQQGWRSMYGWLANKPWISCLGNHDYGGWMFTQGWPVQIGYSFVNHHWIMPARYYHKKMRHHGFTVEYFVTDSNAWDAKHPGQDEKHNICSYHNPAGASCGANGAMTSIWDCPNWFWKSHNMQKRWLKRKLRASTADWKIVVTHFPCGYDASFYKLLHLRYGLDLLVTGHRHQQELWHTGSKNSFIQSNMNKAGMGSLTCFVTGGGGGVDAEAYKGVWYGDRDLKWFGFFHLMIAKHHIRINMIGTSGRVDGRAIVHSRKKHHGPHPHRRRHHKKAHHKR